MDLGETAQATAPPPRLDCQDPRTWPEQLLEARNNFLWAVLAGPIEQLDEAAATYEKERHRWGC